MLDEDGFKLKMFNWLESIIQCQLPEMMEILEAPDKVLLKLLLPKGSVDPRMKNQHKVSAMTEDEFATKFQSFVTDLA